MGLSSPGQPLLAGFPGLLLSFIGTNEHLFTKVNFTDLQRWISHWGSIECLWVCPLSRRREGRQNGGIIIIIIIFCLFRAEPMEVPRLGVKLELQLPAYARATAMADPSRVCNLHHSSQQGRILNPLSKARDQTHNLMAPNRICFC